MYQGCTQLKFIMLGWVWLKLSIKSKTKKTTLYVVPPTRGQGRSTWAGGGEDMKGLEEWKRDISEGEKPTFIISFFST